MEAYHLDRKPTTWTMEFGCILQLSLDSGVAKVRAVLVPSYDESTVFGKLFGRVTC